MIVSLRSVTQIIRATSARRQTFSKMDSRFISSTRVTAKSTSMSSVDESSPKGDSTLPYHLRGVPKYMSQVYWWAYIHPNAVKIFERQWLANWILWGNYKELRDDTIRELASENERIEGDLLQVACVYGNLTELLLKKLSPTAKMHVVDVSPVQIDNLNQKLTQSPILNKDEVSRCIIKQCDGSKLAYEDNSFDQILYFFLLHEVPADVRTKILQEAARVLKPEGKIVFVDYHQPASRLHPQKYIMPFVFHALEPFAMDLWENDIHTWVPDELKRKCTITKELFFGGLYQKVVVTKK